MSETALLAATELFHQREPETTVVDMPLTYAEALEIIAASAARSEWAWEVQEGHSRFVVGRAWSMESAEATGNGVRITCRRINA